jgi:hypothetical protein
VVRVMLIMYVRCTSDLGHMGFQVPRGHKPRDGGVRLSGAASGSAEQGPGLVDVIGAGAVFEVFDQ